ncbi:hypothetical protein EON68_02485, partial [archaeon]
MGVLEPLAVRTCDRPPTADAVCKGSGHGTPAPRCPPAVREKATACVVLRRNMEGAHPRHAHAAWPSDVPLTSRSSHGMRAAAAAAAAAPNPNQREHKTSPTNLTPGSTPGADFAGGMFLTALSLDDGSSATAASHHPRTLSSPG